ncbi:Threonine--tRNA ligase, cytoplasmic [Fusarium oxysporum f. sp. albedinis]|nr:Threonine--tRNA ligase, cytoplasmic [Fusarium oxysporum f. sp. albedinis]
MSVPSAYIPLTGCSVVVVPLSNTQIPCPTVSHLESVTLLKFSDLSCPKPAHPLNPGEKNNKPTIPNQNAAVKKLQAVLAIPNQPLPKTK